ncbi:CPBP family intramembrane glutamic endopeptidase [Clostridium thermarum]|uniref:CPBP family intramembrane glutamic endopeptidase n=1 Tax=Clostridium thermarum TaxID=1716543 RepID=UPI0013D0EA8C|nr:type II CAAX endopeptidase family protein [Clostridium thermarum]
MKKFFSTVWSVLRYLLIYLGSSFIASMLMGAYFAFKYAGDADKIDEALQRNVLQLTGIISLISLVVFLVIVKFCHKSIKDFIQFKKMTFSDEVYCVGITIAFAFFSVSLINLVINIFPSYQQVSETFVTSMDNVVGILLAVILIPIFEEIFFRGIILNELQNRINTVASIIISSLIFALFHGNILQGIYTFIMGVLLSLVYIWTRSIWSAITFHITYNFLGTMVVPVIIYYTESFIVGYLIIGGLLTAVITYLMYKRNKNRNYEQQSMLKVQLYKRDI